MMLLDAEGRTLCVQCGEIEHPHIKCDPVKVAEVDGRRREAFADLIKAVGEKAAAIREAGNSFAMAGVPLTRMRTDDEIDDGLYRDEGHEYVPGEGWR